MSIEPGTYAAGPKNGTLTVRTGKGGAAARAGHNLLIEVGNWGATVQVDADPSQSVLELTADSRSLRVLDGTGGMTTLGEDDKSGITQTIDEEVLKGTAIVFRSSTVEPSGDGRLRVSGDLELAGGINPVTFELELDGEHVRATATVKQSAWGMKPYSALFGTLKVADEVEVSIDAQLTAAG